MQWIADAMRQAVPQEILVVGDKIWCSTRRICFEVVLLAEYQAATDCLNPILARPHPSAPLPLYPVRNAG